MVLGKHGYVYPGRGRPIVRSDENRRDEIIDAAIEIFAQKSAAGVTMKDLARTCHLNPATLYYYYEKRENLLDAMARERLGPAFAHIWKEDNIDSAAGLLTRMVERIFQSCIRMPALPALWMQDILPASGELRPFMIKYAPTEDMARFHNALREFQEQGVIYPEMIPEYIPFMVFSLTLFPMGAKKPTGTLARLPNLGWDDISANALNSILKAVVA